MATIEYVQGQETHTSNWGKFYMKGLEKYAVREDFDENRHDRHKSYQGFACNDVPAGTIFTIFIQGGTKHGTDSFTFLLCEVVDDDLPAHREEGVYRQAWCSGPYRILCAGEGKVRAPRLMEWWITQRPAGVDLRGFALHCAAHIDKRGLKQLPAMAIA